MPVRQHQGDHSQVLCKSPPFPGSVCAAIAAIEGTFRWNTKEKSIQMGDKLTKLQQKKHTPEENPT